MCRRNAIGSFSHLSSLCPQPAIPGQKLRAWNASEISVLMNSWRRKTDREIANLLDRSLFSVRSFRIRNIVRRRLSHRNRWKGNRGRRLSRLIAAEYTRGSSQSRLVQKYGVEWRKLKEILLSRGVQIRGKSQQVFIQRYGSAPRVRSHLGASKLYVVCAMLGDNLRPTDQSKWRTHIIGVAAGPDRDFAEEWAENFKREYGVRPRLLYKGKNNIQAYISSVDIWRDLHRYAVFGSRKWRLNPWLMRLLMNRVPLRTLGYGLRGFFDAEGSFFRHPIYKASGRLTVTSVNYHGLKQISRLLTRLGIRHSFYKKYRNTIGVYARASLETYLQRIGFSIRRKRERLELTIRTAKRIRPS